IGPDMVPHFERILANYLTQGSSIPAWESLGPILKSRYLGDVADAVLGAWGRGDEQTFLRSRAGFVVPVTQTDMEALEQQAKKRVPDANPAQVQRAIKTFILRDANYFYEQGVFKQASDDEIQTDVYRMFGLLLRSSREAKTGDIEEIV